MSHVFKLGDRVRRASFGFANVRMPGARSGDAVETDIFEVVRLVPGDQTGEPAYRIKSSSGERAVREGEITAV